MKFSALPIFERELKRLCKKYPSLARDFERTKLAVMAYPRGQGERHWNLLHDYELVSVFKMRVMCDSLKGSSLRLIYAYSPAENRIEFIELYFKGDKENEDRERIKDYLRGILKS